MSTPSPAPPTPRTLLRKCPQWSTMQWVSLSAMTRIDEKTKRLARIRDVSRGDMIGIMVMYLAPEDPVELWKILDPYLLEHRGAKGKWKDQALMSKLRSPVSLRLDALVARAYD